MTERSKDAISIAVIVAVGVTMAICTWGCWADPIFGSGRELYVPWQLSQGKVLYRDVAHANGPVSAYFNAMLFRLFSPRVHVLELANLAVLAIFVAMIWRLWKLIADRVSATIACALLLLLFAFAQFTGVGGFNFALPSEHELTHGVILTFAAITCLAEYVRKRSSNWLLAAGAALGLAALTKSTIFLAGFVPLVLGTITALFAHRSAARKWRTDLLALLAPVALIPLLACGYLAAHMPWRDALANVFANWRWAWDDQFMLMRHTQAWLGVDRSAVTVGRVLLSLFAYALLLLPAMLAGVFVTRSREERIAVTTIAATVVLSALYVAYDRINWQFDAPAGLTLATVGLAIGMTTMLLHRRRDLIDDVLIVRITIVWTALLFVVQLGLRSVIFEYGFVLALPATLVGVAATLHWLPRAVERAGGFGGVPRAAALAAFSVLTFSHLHAYARSFKPRAVTIGEGADVLHFDPRGLVLRDALQELQSRSSPGQTLLTLPDGAMLNFLSHRQSSTPYVSLMPIETLKIGAENVRETIALSPPDWIIINNASVEAFGSRSFADGYGRSIWQWITPRYEEVGNFSLDSRGSQFTMRLYHRRENQ